MKIKFTFILLVLILSISSVFVIAADPPAFDNEQFYGNVTWAKSATTPSMVSVKVVSTGKVYTSMIKLIGCDDKQCVGKYGYDKDNILRVQAVDGVDKLAFSIGVVEVQKVSYEAGKIVQLNLPEGSVFGVSTGSEAGSQATGNQTSGQSNQSSSSSNNETGSSSTTTNVPQNYCSPEWKCNDWSYCGSDMKQTRICVDLKNCETSKTESKKCDKCDESWQCSVWTSCLNGQQVRTCMDEHKCGTSLKKPSEDRSCAVVGETTQNVPEQTQTYEPEVQQPKSEVSVKEEVKTSAFNWSYVIYGVVGGLVLIGLIIGGYFLMKNRGGSGGDEGMFGELENVYSSMESKGLSDTEITSKLIGKGWDESLVKKFLRKR